MAGKFTWPSATSVLVLTVFLTTTSCSTRQTHIESATPGEVVTCADIELVDRATPVLELPCALDQKLIDLGAIKGPALVNVWGSWCQPCVAETPLLREFHARYSNQVALIGVDIEEETATSGSEFIVSHGITWPQVNDQRSKIRQLSGLGVPTTLFIDANGSIVKKFVGPFDSLDQIIAESKAVFGITLSGQ